MSITIVDKRTGNRDRTTENRQRFLRRIKGAIKEQLPKIIGDRSLKDIDKTGGKIRINRKTITEPFMHHGQGGNIDRVLPGNDEYVEGDRLPKPQSGGGSGGGHGGEDGETDFFIDLSREEFLKFFFEDLELPDLVAAELAKIKEYKRVNAGFQPDGSPNRLNIERSHRNSLGRRITMRGVIDKKIEKVETELKNTPDADVIKIELLLKQIAKLHKKREAIPLFEEMDLRYRLTVKKEIPITHATMIMIMDNSGSMTQREKTIARKFFWLLYSFLSRNYDQIDMVFISHTTSAVEMDEDEFFNTRITGGTIVSTALELTANLVKGVEPSEYLGTLDRSRTNIYVAQVSDGDNEDTDNGTCSEILEDDILPYVRYFAYVQVDNYHDSSNATLATMMSERGLWKSYKTVAEKNSRLQVRRVMQESDIYPVFRDLLAKKHK